MTLSHESQMRAEKMIPQLIRKNIYREFGNALGKKIQCEIMKYQDS
jgi:hypothetical protein